MEIALIALGVVTVIAVAFAVVSYQRATKATRQLSRLANFDTLTGLPNRNQLIGWLGGMLKDSRRKTARVALYFVELNRFEYLNDTYGHEVGDALMLAASKALRAGVTKSDILVRYGGPQFVLAVSDVPDPTQARKRAEEVLDAVQRTYEIGQDRIRLSANVGIALTDQQLSNPDDVILDAGVALQQAIAEGAGEFALFDQSMRSHLTPSTAEHRLREALDRDEFWLLYMPVVDLKSNALVGVEALLRWADPESGLVAPAQFMQSLEETGLIVPVGDWVLREACRQAKVWQDQYPGREFEVTVNVSPRQLMQSNFVEAVVTAINETGVDASGICLEITEGALMQDVEAMWATLRQVKGIGVKLALDDFGTGYSSLSYLRRFRLDSLKIDSTFVTDVTESREDQAIVEQIIGLTHALGMTSTAEGVEKAEQVKMLTDLGCDAAQGYFYSTPQPDDVIDGLLAKGRLDRSDRPATLKDVTRPTGP